MKDNNFGVTVGWVGFCFTGVLIFIIVPVILAVAFPEFANSIVLALVGSSVLFMVVFWILYIVRHFRERKVENDITSP